MSDTRNRRGPERSAPATAVPQEKAEGPRIIASLARCARPLQVCCALLLIVCGVGALLAPHNSSFVYRRPLVWLFTAMWLAGWISFRRRPARFLASARTERIVAVALASMAAIVGVLSRYPYAWDARIVQRAALTLSQGRPLPSSEYRYFSVYPNNLPLLSLDQGFYEIAGTFGLSVSLVVVFFNCLCFLGILLCVSSTARRLGHPRGAIAIQLTAFVLVGSSPIVAVPYSDLPAALATAVAVWCAVVWRTTHVTGTKFAAVIGAAAALGVGAAFKPYVLVLLCALVITMLVYVGRLLGGRRRVSSLLLVPVAIVASWAGLQVTNVAAHAVTGISGEALRSHGSSMPPLHFVQMGLHDSHDDSPTRSWGGYDPEGVAEAVSTADESRRHDLVQERLTHELQQQGVLGTSSFLVHKALWVWGDGSFWSQGEGSDRFAKPLFANPVAEVTLQAGALFSLRAAFSQGLWIALLLVTGTMLLRREASVAVVWMSTSVLGLTAYLLLFEGRPRYLIALLPTLLVLAQLTTGAPHPATRRSSTHTGATRHDDF